ncbi:hypothetical protein RvY_13856 [Ramazzottius varieornatus]|uniref:Uncharacterized protein n=1 Tax=Ramazzottius varieornatus TaxID=947166 RepID=A0A1D1VTA3_RAMVA|nr:hypothetical protein RvY_13856 [Ramazzottius varieornatus]
MEGKRKHREDASISGSVSGDSVNEMESVHSARPNVYLPSKSLPKFGAKLSVVGGQEEQVRERLERIYDSKLRAFQHARFCDVSVRSNAGKGEDRGQCGTLDAADLTVFVKRLSGGFRQHFGQCRNDALTGSQMTILSPLEAFFLVDLGSLEVRTKSGCPLPLQDFRAMLEAQVTNFASRYNIFSEVHRSTQLILKPYSSAGGIEHPMKETSGGGEEVQAEDLSALVQVNTAVSDDRHEGSSLFAGSADSASSVVEMPSYDFDRWMSSVAAAATATASSYPQSLQPAFSCHSKSSGSTSSSLFDVVLTDYQKKDIAFDDLFMALLHGQHSNATVYFARDDVGELSGFAAILADIPSVHY